MKKVHLSIFILLAFGNLLHAQKIYPGKSFVLAPEFNSGYLLPLGEGNSGAGFEFGMAVIDLIPRVSLAVSGGYGFLSQEDAQVIPFPLVSLKGGYRFPLGKVFSLYPTGKFSLLWPAVESGTSLVGSFAAGAVLDLHIYERNYLSLESFLAFPFITDLPPYLSIKIGIKHAIPFKRAVPPLEMSLTVEPEVFSPDDDGEGDMLNIYTEIKNASSTKKWNLRIYDHTGSLIFSKRGRGIPPSPLLWNGLTSSHILVSSVSDFSLELELIDLLGNSTSQTGTFLTDVFVFLENGKLKIRVPGIIFPPGTSDFSSLLETEQSHNLKIIKKIALTLQKFPEYRILIEGHGNLINWKSRELAEIEQNEILLPLSESRAREIKQALIKEGISSERMDVAGRGGQYPLVPFADEPNRWRNRRVDFILLK